MLLGSICAISALRRRAYSDLGMLIKAGSDRQSVQGGFGGRRDGLGALGEQQQRRHTQVLHDLHVVAVSYTHLNHGPSA